MICIEKKNGIGWLAIYHVFFIVLNFTNQMIEPIFDTFLTKIAIVSLLLGIKSIFILYVGFTTNWTLYRFNDGVVVDFLFSIIQETWPSSIVTIFKRKTT